MPEDHQAEAAELLRLSLAAMAKHKLPTTPRNYAVWFAYFEGVNGALKDAMDNLLVSGEALSPTQMSALHRDHVASFEFRVADHAREVLRRLLAGAVLSFADATRELGNFAGALDDISERLTPEATSDDIRSILGDLMTETDVIRTHSGEVSSTLAERQREVEILRKELAEARKQASIDPLTGLANRSRFDEQLDELRRVHAEDRIGFGLIMIDIDRFKVVNDTHGHLVGDKVIRFVAKTILDCVKGRDIAARFGGEEFAILLPETGLDGCRAVAESIRSAMAASRLVKSGSGDPIGTVTVSCGIATHQLDEAADALIDRADAALYNSKRAGRNQVSGEDEVCTAAVANIA